MSRHRLGLATAVVRGCRRLRRVVGATAVVAVGLVSMLAGPLVAPAAAAEIPVTDCAQLSNAVTGAAPGDVVVVMNDISMDCTVDVPTTVAVRSAAGQQFTLLRAAGFTGAFFTSSVGGADLTITDLILDGNGDVADSNGDGVTVDALYPLIYFYPAGAGMSSLTLGSGSVVRHNRNMYATTEPMRDDNQANSGVRLHQGVLTVEGDAVVDSNTCNACFGAGIGVSGGAEVVIRDQARVTNNTNLNTLWVTQGAGVFAETSTVTITGGAVVSGNEATFGAGVYVFNNAELTVSGDAQIRDNTGVSDLVTEAGGLMAEGPGTSVTITDNAVISGNSADYGAGVFALNNTDLTISGNAQITNNAGPGDRPTQGGGLMVQGPDTSALITDNAVISGNSADYGAGIILIGVHYTTTVSLLVTGDAQVTGNQANVNGGGIASAGWNVSVVLDESAQVSGNTAAERGGGMWLVDLADLLVTGDAQVAGNEAGIDGGGIWAGLTDGFGLGVPTLAVSGAARVTGNAAGNDGGGVYLEQSDLGTSTLDVSGTVLIADNTAVRNGGGIWVNWLQDLGQVTVGPDVEFAGNTAWAPYLIKESDIPLHRTNILTALFSEPFNPGVTISQPSPWDYEEGINWGYNNFDIAYAGQKWTVDDEETTTVDTPVSLNVLDNDADNLTLTAVGPTEHGGTVTFDASGQMTYTPPPGFTGVDTFVYTATYAVMDPDGTTHEETITATVTITVTATPALTLVKSVSPERVAGAGEQVTYTFTVTNSGQGVANDLAVNESDFSGTGDLGDIVCAPVGLGEDLGPGASTTCTATYTVTEQDAAAGRVVNTAIATATDSVGGPVTSNPSTATLTITEAPAPSPSPAPGPGPDLAALPDTGGNLTPILLAGAVLVVLGSVLTARWRKTTT